MSLDSLELQLASAIQRFNALQRRAGNPREPIALLTKSLQELSTALEEIRVAQEQLLETRGRMETLQEELRRQNERYWRLFDDLPQAYVVTRPDSVITEVNKAGAQLFNVSQRFLVGKALSVFVCENRGGFLTMVAEAVEHRRTVQLTFKLRPRERAPVSVSARVQGDEGSVRWLLQPEATGILDAPPDPDAL